MRKTTVRLSVAFLFFAALPLGCSSSPSSPATGSGGSSGGARSGGAGGGTSSKGGVGGGSSETGNGGSTSTGGGSGGSISTGGGSGGSTSTGGGSGGASETGGGGSTSDATGGSSGTGGDATGGAGTGGGTSDATGGSSGTGGAATGGMSAGGGGGNSGTGGGTNPTGGAQVDAQDGPGGAGNSGSDGGEGETVVSCTDDVQNGAETDVDCGGGTCAKCASGLMCNVDDDCRNGSCISGKCADSFVATAPVTQNGNMWRITLGTVIFEVDPSNAGKVATFSIDGTDVVAKNTAATGSAFWTSPQDEWYATPTQTWPPPAEMDSSAYTPSTSGNVLTMTGPVGDDQLSISKRYWGNVENQAVTLEYTIHNNNSAAVSKAPWEITRVYTGGLTFFPSSELGVGLGDASFGPVPFTSVQGALWFKYDSSDFTTISSLKGGADGLEGWAAHIACTGLEDSWAYPTCTKSPILIKEWTDIPAAAAAPGEKEVEIYALTNSYVEFEQQGAYQSIPAGGTVVWTMHWLLRYLPRYVAPTAGSADLLTWVRGQLL